VTALLLDTHVVYWLWVGDTHRLSSRALDAVGEAEELAVAAISWYELALLFERRRIELVATTARAALGSMAERVITVPLSWPVAERAAELEREQAFPRDPADRLIFATASVQSMRLVTADGAMRSFSQEVCLW
jgi:PIN domain nuclease of toxin-antitoxin system